MQDAGPLNDYPPPDRPISATQGFPRVVIDRCALITTTIYCPSQGNFRVAPEVLVRDPSNDKAYWLQHRIRDALYGEVRFARVLRRRADPIIARNGDRVIWEELDISCAIKCVDRERLRTRNLAEDPIQEIYAMHFMREQLCQREESIIQEAPFVEDALMTIMEKYNVLLPLDAVQNDDYIYNVMPFIDGGELFDLFGERERFSEGEARYWVRQILNGIRTLQSLRVCHRDISLENILILNNRCCLIMDFGMTFRVPYTESGERQLVSAAGTMGKWNYMAPEIALNTTPFDGHTVDLWAVGVILFMMVVGFQPWERPLRTDQRFRYMSGGYLAAVLQDWGFNLSDNLSNLLQDLLWFDPRDRRHLLTSIMSHSWMLGADEPPQDPDAMME